MSSRGGIYASSRPNERGHANVLCNANAVCYRKLHNRECQYFDIVESLDGSHFVMSCQGPDVPYTCIHSTADNEIVSVWEDNSDLIKTIADVALPRVEFLEVPVPGQDLKVQGRYSVQS